MASNNDDEVGAYCCIIVIVIIIIIVICYAVYWFIQQSSNYLHNMPYGAFLITIIGLLIWIAYEIYRSVYSI